MSDSETTTVEPTVEPDAGTVGQERGPRLTRRVIAGLAAALVLLGLLGWGSYAIWEGRQLEQSRTDALDAGRRYATDLATYSFENLDNNLSVVRGNSVGEFAGQYTQVASNLKDMIVQYKATSSAEIIAAGLAEADRDRAEVIVFLDQTVTNTNSPEPRVDRNRMRLSLVHEGGAWKLANVQLL
ncbi:hypothetical protein [Rhodococcus daqingensis]|uniref:Mce-associated membrane protein n=1 Tax=Rhodococcus daqingensis TaxID=2479363 RepID=A0ABW2RZI4_9NOCA